MSVLTALEHSLCLDHNPLKISVSFRVSAHLERASPLEGGAGLPWQKGRLGCLIQPPLQGRVAGAVSHSAVAWSGHVLALRTSFCRPLKWPVKPFYSDIRGFLRELGSGG